LHVYIHKTPKKHESKESILSNESKIMHVPKYTLFNNIENVTPINVQPDQRTIEPNDIVPHVSGGYTGYSPLQIRQVYGITSLSNTLTGAGQVIAIVNAYGYPNVVADLTAFSTEFNLPRPNVVTTKAQLIASPIAGTFNFMIYSPNGLTPVNNAEWSMEQSLDIQWAHAIAPSAAIVLIQASDASDVLFDAVTTAVQLGASVVSMSWGSGEYSQETLVDTKYFQPNSTSTLNPVTFVASAGDSVGVSYPAASPYVLSVGGTTLKINTINNVTSRASEVVWSNLYGSTGGGQSTYEALPSYQKNNVSNITMRRRGDNDVALSADPAYGVPIYNSFYRSGTVWYQIGGTSFSAPVWAAIIALANQLRAQNNKRALSTSVLHLGIYALLKKTTGTYTHANCFYDIASGRNSLVSSSKSYDLASGLGSPIVNKLVPYLATL
jgi:subtilase family serine protease